MGTSQIDPGIMTALAAEEFRTRLGAVAELTLQMDEVHTVAARGARRLLQRHLQRERDYQVRRAITKALGDGSNRLPEAVARAVRQETGASHALAVLIEVDDGPERIDFGGSIHLAIAAEEGVESRRSRIYGRDWVRLGAVELGLDCLRRYLQASWSPNAPISSECNRGAIGAQAGLYGGQVNEFVSGLGG